jgi:hypothetical protein
VKAALHRGREKLATLRDEPARRDEPLPLSAQQYIDAFNRRTGPRWAHSSSNC